MPPRRQATIVQDRSSGRWAVSAHENFSDAPTDNRFIRLLILDADPKTLDLIENALWIWPHKLAAASSVQEAVRMCDHLEPVAIIVALDFPNHDDVDIITALRHELPNLAIIAIGSAADVSNAGTILDLGADAFLPREELQRPTLHDLLTRLGSPSAIDTVQQTPLPARMTLPWRDSKIIGSLICDIKGTITSANECLATWLEYPASAELLGKCVWRDILASRADWTPWKTVAGDLTKLLHQSVAVKARNNQRLWMKVQVFAAPDSPSNLQAVFVDQTELAHLSGRFKVCNPG